MTEITIGSAQSYTVPLQSFDLTHLSRYVLNPREEKKPLWSNKYIDGESQYYTVEIVAQDINEHDCYDESTATYICYMCNLLVPNIYYNEHNESKEHETFKRICEQVLDRVFKQMNGHINNNDKEIAEDLYYCTLCSKAIKLKNKHKHESSKYHKDSQEKIEASNNFYKTCIANENNDIHITKKHLDVKQYLKSDNYSFRENIEDISNNNNLESITNGYNNFDKIKNETLDSDDDFSESEDENTKSVSSIDHIPTESEEIETSFESYLKEMIAKYKLKVNLPYTDGDYIHVVSPSGEKQKIPYEYFHSYKKFHNYIYCQICKTCLSLNTNAHDKMETHVNNIFKPVNEKFIRMIDKVSSHCLICNEAVMDQSTHQPLSHSKIKTYDCNEEDVVLKQNQIVKVNSEEYFCKICDVLLARIAVFFHINCSFHVAKKSDSYTEPIVDNCKLLANKLEEDKCVVKDVTIQNDTKDSYSTVKNKNDTVFHNETKNIFSIVQDTTISDNTDNTKTKVNCDDGVDQRENRSYANKINNDKIDAYYKLLQCIKGTNKKMCRICGTKVIPVPQNIIEHMQDVFHKGNVNNVISYHTIKKEPLKGYFCKCCGVSFSDFFDHINSKEHVIKFQFKYIINRRLLKKYVYEDNADSSIASLNRELYNNLLKCNNITKTSHSTFYCGICCLKLTSISEIDHVLGGRHMNAMPMDIH